MCVICVKNKGVSLPSIDNIKAMWKKNPDGAGYMYSRNGQLYIRKGYMDVEKFIKDVYEEVKPTDPAVLHFRISTQGHNAAMTHPFPLSTNLKDMETLNWDGDAKIGIAHNGIISLTTDHREHQYSDTALFITNYLTRIVRRADDLDDPYIKDIIGHLISGGYPNKLAILDQDGIITLIGKFEERNGLQYSNLYHDVVKMNWFGVDTKSDDDIHFIEYTSLDGTVKKIPVYNTKVRQMTDNRLDLNYTTIEIYNKNKSPNYLGVKDHGSRCVVILDKKSIKNINNKYDLDIGRTHTLNFFEDKSVNIMRTLDGKENIVYEFKGKKLESIQNELDWMFKSNNVMQFDKVIIKGLNDVLKLFTINKNYIMFNWGKRR